MSESEIDSSNDAVYQTPGSIIIIDGPEAVEPLTEDLGASPTLGPVTRSGRKRKISAAPKSSGKKKKTGGMIRSPGKNVEVPSQATGASGAAATGGNPQPDLAQLLTNGLSGIQASMGGMETRLSNKIDLLEEGVNKNKNTIEILTEVVSKNCRVVAP